MNGVEEFGDIDVDTRDPEHICISVGSAFGSGCQELSHEDSLRLYRQLDAWYRKGEA